MLSRVCIHSFHCQKIRALLSSICLIPNSFDLIIMQKEGHLSDQTDHTLASGGLP